MATKQYVATMSISVLSGDYAIPTTAANDRQPMTSYSCLVVTLALSTTHRFTHATLASASISRRHVCPSVRPSVRLSQVGVLLKRLKVGSRKQRHTIAQEL